MEANQLVKEIDNIIKNDYQFENEEFENCIFKKLKDNNEETNRKGFMIFAERVDNFEMDADYPYKRRYYYVEKLNDNKNNENKKIIFVLFNCSTSNPDKLDPTVKNCKWLAKEKYKRQYSQIEVLNLFSIRESRVQDITTNDLRDDKFNLEFIIKLLDYRKDSDIVLAWGYGKEKKYTIKSRTDKNKAIFEQICNIKKELNNNTYNVKKITSIKDCGKKAHHPDIRAWYKYGDGKESFKKNCKIIDYESF